MHLPFGCKLDAHDRLAECDTSGFSCTAEVRRFPALPRGGHSVERDSRQRWLAAPDRGYKTSGADKFPDPDGEGAKIAEPPRAGAPVNHRFAAPRGFRRHCCELGSLVSASAPVASKRTAGRSKRTAGRSKRRHLGLTKTDEPCRQHLLRSGRGRASGRTYKIKASGSDYLRV